MNDGNPIALLVPIGPFFAISGVEGLERGQMAVVSLGGSIGLETDTCVAVRGERIGLFRPSKNGRWLYPLEPGASRLWTRATTILGTVKSIVSTAGPASDELTGVPTSFLGGTHLMLTEVSGDHMLPDIAPGDRVAIQLLQPGDPFPPYDSVVAAFVGGDMYVGYLKAGARAPWLSGAEGTGMMVQLSEPEHVVGTVTAIIRRLIPQPEST
jgi:hypothetical protein